nr:hypothetical protein RAR13_04300 [Aminobacter aminovorans]
MNSIFSVTTPAADTSLLTIAELRAAAGVSDSSQDAALTTLGARVSASIARACGVASDGVNPPTLLRETCSEIYRPTARRDKIVLSRRPVTSISSITEGDEALTSDAYELSKPSGILTRLSSDYPTCWPCGKIIVVYIAGFATVPDDLKLAASKLTTALYAETARDPSLKRERVDGVGEFEYWVAPSDDPLLSAEISDLIAPYRQIWL